MSFLYLIGAILKYGVVVLVGARRIFAIERKRKIGQLLTVISLNISNIKKLLKPVSEYLGLSLSKSVLFLLVCQIGTENGPFKLLVF